MTEKDDDVGHGLRKALQSVVIEYPINEHKILSEQDRTIKVAAAMMRYGGSFVEALGKTLMVADPVNTRKIKEAFLREWNEYAALAGIEA